jgi:Fic/DOC family
MVERDLEHIAMACVVECRRQGVGLDRLACLLAGYNYAMDNAGRLPTEGDLLHLASVVEPSTGGRYRTTPVTFSQGGTAADPGSVPGATARLLALFDVGDDPQEFVHHFLAVHPFADGNGRLGFILYNWLMHTLPEPRPLPEFQFS